MPKRYVGYTSRGPTVLRNVRSESGYPLVLMEQGETAKIDLDLSSLIEGGETVSSVTVAGSGITASVALSGSNATVTLSGPSAWGEATVTMTLSSGEVFVETIRARQNARAYDPTSAAYAL